MSGVNHLATIHVPPVIVLLEIVHLEIVRGVLARKVTTLIDLVQNVAGQNVAGQNGPAMNVQKDAARKAEGLKDVGQKVRTGLRESLSQSKAKSPGFRKTFMAMLMV